MNDNIKKNSNCSTALQYTKQITKQNTIAIGKRKILIIESVELYLVINY